MDKKTFEVIKNRLSEVNAVVAGLDPVVRGPAFEILRPYVTGAGAQSASRPSAGQGGPGPGPAAVGDESFAEFLGRAATEDGVDRALLACYWQSQRETSGTFTAQAANALLKDAGHASTNITRDLDSLRSRKPQLVVQVRKSGRSKQARKLYRVTDAGARQAGALLRSDADQ